jgi:DNA-directed RNA polymerase subunit RPC12/RpoP
MHYTRKIEQNPNDVRSRTFFVYKCNICGHDEWFRYVEHFDTKRLRECPSCGTVDDTNDKEYLITKKKQIEIDLEKLKKQIESLNEEYSSIIRKIDVMNIEQNSIQKEIINEK